MFGGIGPCSGVAGLVKVYVALLEATLKFGIVACQVPVNDQAPESILLRSDPRFGRNRL